MEQANSIGIIIKSAILHARNNPTNPAMEVHVDLGFETEYSTDKTTFACAKELYPDLRKTIVFRGHQNHVKKSMGQTASDTPNHSCYRRSSPGQSSKLKLLR